MAVAVAKSNEPIWWSLFSAGGMATALFLPVLIVITGVLLPLGEADEALAYERIRPIVAHPIVKLLLFATISLTFFHWAHRFRFTLVDIGLRKVSTVISICCYGGAIVGTFLAVLVLWKL